MFFCWQYYLKKNKNCIKLIEKKINIVNNLIYDYRENLYALLFNVWKNNILSLSKQQLLDLKQRGSYQGNIYELYDSLSQQDKNIDTYEELQQVFNCFPLVEKYCWYNYCKNNTSFVHISIQENYVLNRKIIWI